MWTATHRLPHAAGHGSSQGGLLYARLGHNAKAGYTERPEEYVEVMERLARKFETARKLVPKPVIEKNGTSKIGIIAYGTSHYAIHRVSR
jgi:hypothetical protein